MPLRIGKRIPAHRAIRLIQNLQGRAARWTEPDIVILTFKCLSANLAYGWINKIEQVAQEAPDPEIMGSIQCPYMD